MKHTHVIAIGLVLAAIVAGFVVIKMRGVPSSASLKVPGALCTQNSDCQSGTCANSKCQ